MSSNIAEPFYSKSTQNKIGYSKSTSKALGYSSIRDTRAVAGNSGTQALKVLGHLRLSELEGHLGTQELKRHLEIRHSGTWTQVLDAQVLEHLGT